MHLRLASLALFAFITACAAQINYTDPAGPRYLGGTATESAERGSLKVVSFNLAYARHIDSAIALLRESDALRDMDVLLLQEMDEPSTREVARAFGFDYVYYPATLHPVTKRDFGNAILSRFPMEDDRKVLLPHLALVRNTPRIAVGATIRVGGHRVRVYSVHIATMANNGPRARREQLGAVLADADSSSSVIIGGDFNSSTVPAIAIKHGYTWPTRHIGRTMALWSLDHVLLKGVSITADTAMGTVKETRGASDHRPVWIEVALSVVGEACGGTCSAHRRKVRPRAQP